MKVLVIGAGGIGSAVAKKLADRGDEVTVTYATGQGASRASILSKELGIKIDKFFVEEPEKTTIYLSSFFDPLHPLNAVVYAAGVVFPGSLAETTLEQAKRTFNVNFWGPFVILREASRLLPDGGKIIFFSSSTSLRASPGLATYAASKAALNSLIESAAEELIGQGIRVYNLCLGRVATQLRTRIAPEEDPATIMQPEIVAEVVAFILSGPGDALSSFPVRVHLGPYPGGG